MKRAMANQDQFSIDNSAQETVPPQEQIKPEISTKMPESIESIAENKIAEVDRTSGEAIGEADQRLERAKTYYELPSEKTEEVLSNGGFKEQLALITERIRSLADSTKEKILNLIGKKEVTREAPTEKSIPENESELAKEMPQPQKLPGIKFSFDSQKYRRNLADKLREERITDRDTAKNILDNEKKTKRYQISKDIKRVSIENKKITGENNTETEVEIQTFDISDKIPEDIKLYFDEIRLGKIKKNFKLHKKYESGIQEEYQKEYSEGFYDGKYLRKMMENNLKDLPEESREKYIENMLDRDRAQTISAYETQLWDKRIKDFINEITEEAFYNPLMFCHAVGASQTSAKAENMKKLLSRYVQEDDNAPQEEVFDATTATASSLWFNAGGESRWFNPTKIIILCNAKNERFQNEVSGVGFYREKDAEETKFIRNKSMPEMLKLLAERESAIKGGSTGGIRIDFKKEEKWMDIADWIVDLYHSRLYKIATAKAVK